MTSATDKQRILLAGCGQLGSLIGLALARNHQVWGLRRNAERIPQPLKPLQGNLLEPAALAAILPPELDTVIYCLTPAQYDDAGYKAAFVTALDNLLTILEQRARPPRRVFFISSTGVYHQDDDSWVDETSPTLPTRFSGRRLLEGEARLAQSPLASTSVRFSGIYGGQRRGLLEGIKAGRIAAATDTPFGNRIHEQDCVGVVAHLVARLAAGEPLAECYLASDCEPVRQGELVQWIRRQITCAEPVADARTLGRAGSKRCSNQRLLESGYRFRYPGFREGYKAMF